MLFIAMAPCCQKLIGPRPMHDVVVSAVRKAVSAATIIFTASSISRFFVIIIHYPLSIIHPKKRRPEGRAFSLRSVRHRRHRCRHRHCRHLRRYRRCWCCRRCCRRCSRSPAQDPPLRHWYWSRASPPRRCGRCR